MSRAFFVTGTDTGIGKTVASVALLHALRARGQRAVGMKPVASGCDATPDGLRNEDAVALQLASDPSPPYDDINPFAFGDPTTPELAATLDGGSVTLPPIEAAFARLRASADTVIVEGAGGWLAPWSPTLMQSDLVRVLDLPVLLVVGLRLGSISHSWLTAHAIRAEGLQLAGWIGNAVDPGWRHPQANIDILARGIDAPCLGLLPHGTRADAPPPAGTLSLDALLTLRA